MDIYSTSYSDVNGSESTTIANDGNTLRILIRGVEFTGPDFASLSPNETNRDASSLFDLRNGELRSFRIQYQVNIPMLRQHKVSAGTLNVNLTIGASGYDSLNINLGFRNKHYSSSSGLSFEPVLVDIQNQLPADVFFKACLNCQYSDYSPFGNQEFGDMLCFRNIKQTYSAVNSKDDFLAIHDRFERRVQETFLCDQFERRTPDTGYRG